MEESSEEMYCIEDEETLDPRIQEELNQLNQTSSEINHLENEIDEARTQYRQTLSDASQSMKQLGSKLKRNIHRARPYYELKEKAIQAQSEALRAARQYQSANGIYRAAKETVSLAEERLVEVSHSLTSAWQEMLNHATMRVMEAEREKRRSETEHHQKASAFSQLETKLQFLESKFRRSINKARPYFEMKAELELKLKQQKQNLEDLQAAVRAAKGKYAASLKQLESISETIHAMRKKKLMMMLPRQPGVGAESDSLTSSLSDTSSLEGEFMRRMVLDSIDGDPDSDSESDQSYADSDVFQEEMASQASPPLDGDRYVEGKQSPDLSVYSKYSADGAENEGQMQTCDSLEASGCLQKPDTAEHISSEIQKSIPGQTVIDSGSDCRTESSLLST